MPGTSGICSIISGVKTHAACPGGRGQTGRCPSLAGRGVHAGLGDGSPFRLPLPSCLPGLTTICKCGRSLPDACTSSQNGSLDPAQLQDAGMPCRGSTTLQPP